MIYVSFEIRVHTPSLANLREHWGARKRRAALHRQLAFAVTVGACEDVRRWRELTRGCEATLVRRSPRALDDDNLCGALKSIRDGIADAFGVDDRDPRITWRYAQARSKVPNVLVGLVL